MCSSESSLLKLHIISGTTYDTFCPIRRIRELTQRRRQRNDKEDPKKGNGFNKQKKQSLHNRLNHLVLFLVITARLRPETSLIHVYVGSVHKTSNKCPIVNHRKHKRRSLNFDSSMSLKVKLNRGLNTCLISSVQSVQTKMMSTFSLMEGILS